MRCLLLHYRYELIHHCTAQVVCVCSIASLSDDMACALQYNALLCQTMPISLRADVAVLLLSYATACLYSDGSQLLNHDVIRRLQC